eukprot:4350616-Amphidinium_carterae.1
MQNEASAHAKMRKSAGGIAQMVRTVDCCLARASVLLSSSRSSTHNLDTRLARSDTSPGDCGRPLRADHSKLPNTA